MKRILQLIIFICLISTSSDVIAQLPSNPIGANPLRLKWNQINTDKVQVIFPEGLESQGQRVANLVEYMWENNTSTIGNNQKKVTILLQNQSLISNAFVTVAPFRSEFVVTPPQFDCTTGWLESLTIHEYRHVMQFGNATKGITKTAKTLLGDWAWGGLMATALPRWYFEGDAVVFETGLSSSGRGRLPAFLMEYRSLFESGNKYSYEKAAAGSLKDFVPDWYHLGYYMVSYARKEFGKDIWSNVVNDAVRYKGLFFPLSRNLKKQTGLSTTDLYHQSIDAVSEEWGKKVSSTNMTKFDIIETKRKNTVTDYTNPFYLQNDQILALKSSFDQLEHFVILDKNGKEEKLTEAGILLDGNFNRISYNSGKICWSALDFSIRRRNQNFSDVYIYNISEKKKKKITQREQLFSPSISPDGNKIVAIEIKESLDNTIVILDPTNGNIIKRIENPENHFYSFPVWTENQEKIVAIEKSGENHALVSFDLTTGEEEQLTPSLPEQLSYPLSRGDFIYFSSTYTGINNIFAVNTGTKQIYQLSSTLLGHYQFDITDESHKIVVSSFSSEGFELQEMAFDTRKMEPYKIEKEDKNKYVFRDVFNGEGESILNKAPEKKYAVKKFRKWSGMIKPHSLLPILEPPLAGLQLFSDNKFSTLSADASAFYNFNENNWRYGINLSYAELFPVINTGFNRYNRSALFIHFNQLNDTSVVRTILPSEWSENTVQAGLSLPLNFSEGNFIKRLSVSANYRRIKTDFDNDYDPNLQEPFDTLLVSPSRIAEFEPLYIDRLTDNQTLHSFDISLSYNSLKRLAKQNIRPQWGYNVGVFYRNTFSHHAIQGQVLLGRADLFLPGIGSNHSLFINGMYQKEDLLDNYRFSDRFVYPRGYDFSLRRDEFSKFGINYSFPLWYPDKAIGPIAFIKRVKANLFYDHGIMKISSFPFIENSDLMRSGGIELTFDFRALRLLEVDLGVRYSYLIDSDFIGSGSRHAFDFLLISIRE